VSATSWEIGYSHHYEAFRIDMQWLSDCAVKFVKWSTLQLGAGLGLLFLTVIYVIRLLNGAIFNDLEQPVVQFSRSRYHLMLNNSETV